MTELAELPYDMEPVHVGERVAFREDHAQFGNTELTVEDTTPESTHYGEMRPQITHEKHAMYGVVRAVGVLDGKVCMDVVPFDPLHGLVDEDAQTHRITMEDIQ